MKPVKKYKKRPARDKITRHEDRFFSALIPENGTAKDVTPVLAPVVLNPADAELYVMTCPSHTGKYEIVVLGGTPFLIENLNFPFNGNLHKHIDDIKPVINFSPGTLYHWKGQVITRKYEIIDSKGEWLETVLFSSKKIPPPKKGL